MKLKKKSGLMGAVIALSAASLVSVGFASWVITQGDTKTSEGSILVDDVDNEIHQISYQWVTTAEGTAALTLPQGKTGPNVVYGTSSNTKEGKWLYNEDEDYLEKLDFFLKVTVTNAAGKAVNEIFDTEASIFTSANGGTVSGKTGYAGAAEAVWGPNSDKSYVGALPVLDFSGNFTTSGTDGVVIFAISFKWGSLFNQTNPFDYYNNGKTAATHGEEANVALTNIHTLLNGAGYTLTLKVN